MHYPPTQIAESGVKNFFSDDGSVTLHPISRRSWCGNGLPTRGSDDAAPEVRAVVGAETHFPPAPQVGFSAGEPPEEISMSV